MATETVKDDQQAPQERIARAREQLARASDASERIALLAEIGTNECILRDPAAIKSFEQAIAIARESHDEQAETVNAIRLAATLQHLSHPDAIRAFEQSLDLCRKQTMQDHCLQALGEFNLRLGRTEEAISMLEEALTLRQVTGNMALVEQTMRSLASARKRLKAQSAQSEAPASAGSDAAQISDVIPAISLLERISYRSFAVVQLGLLVLIGGVLALNGFTLIDAVALLIMLVVTVGIQRVRRTRPTEEVNELEQLRTKLDNGAKYTLVELFGTYCVGCVAVNPLVDQLEIEGNPRLQVLRLNIESPPGVYLKPDKAAFTPTFLLFDPHGNKIRETYLIVDRARILYEVERLSRGSGPLTTS